MKPLGEFDLIERYFSRRSVRADVLLGIGDDAAQSLLARARRSFREICSVALRLEFNYGDASPPAETP